MMISGSTLKIESKKNNKYRTSYVILRKMSKNVKWVPQISSKVVFFRELMSNLVILRKLSDTSVMIILMFIDLMSNFEDFCHFLMFCNDLKNF